MLKVVTQRGLNRDANAGFSQKITLIYVFMTIVQMLPATSWTCMVKVFSFRGDSQWVFFWVALALPTVTFSMRCLPLVLMVMVSSFMVTSTSGLLYASWKAALKAVWVGLAMDL